ncbi:MAG: BON domain-containing protein, partial [Burkholderiaceae bacterium]
RCAPSHCRRPSVSSLRAADAKKITVLVSGGDVTLTSSVHSWSERDLATHSAWGEPGVRRVVDKMNLVY